MAQSRKKFLATTAAASTAALFPNIVLAKGEPIRLGAIPPITGANSLLGEQGARGVKLAVEVVNKRKGKVYDDRPFEIVTEDATSENQTAVAAMNKLVSGNVDAIVLPVLSTQIQAMAPVVKPSGIPWMTGGTAIKNTQLGLENLFRCRPSDGITANAMVAFAVKDLKKSKVAILHSSEAFGVGGAAQMDAALKKLGVTAVANEGYPIDVKDFTPEMLKFKAAGADAILMYIQNPVHVRLALDSYRQQALNVPVIGSPSVTNEQALETSGKAAEGVYGAMDFIVGSPRVNEFIKLFDATYHGKPDIGTGSGWVYDSILLLADTYRKIGTTDKAKTVAALHQVKGWEGVLGTFTCDAEGNMLHEIGIAQVEGGKPKVVKKVEG